MASSQDAHGYSLIHAAVSYNHLDLLRSLIQEFHVNVDLKDEDGETALFVAETPECARMLVEEFHSDTTVRGEEGKTAAQTIEEEGDFPEVAAFLRSLETAGNVTESHGVESHGVGATSEANGLHHPPPLPEGISMDVGTMPAEDQGEVVDPEFKRRIEELAARGDFQGEEGQRELRELITEAVMGQVGEGRNVQRRTS